MTDSVTSCLSELMEKTLSPLDLLPHADTREKLIELVLKGGPQDVDLQTASLFQQLRTNIVKQRVDDCKVVVFGGGTGLSNIIGGDCRNEGWTKNPFVGLKQIFPKTRSVVCVTDDGGSTGELLKDLPLFALGDIRHVMLSSVQLNSLRQRYDISEDGARGVAQELAKLFNYRFTQCPGTVDGVLAGCLADISVFPEGLLDFLFSLFETILTDDRLRPSLKRPNCLGNIMLAAAIYSRLDSTLSNEYLAGAPQTLHTAIFAGLSALSQAIGADDKAVLPCTSTAAQLCFRYTNGVQVTGEHKSGHARRGYPVDRVYVNFCDDIRVYPEIIEDILAADILVMAPGSLYSSIIPVFQVPGLADAVRANRSALKLLISNLWVQTGETDISIVDPERKFHVSDMIDAYEKNIPGGTEGLFEEVLCLSFQNVPASVMQRYALEGKIPIYLDRDVVSSKGYVPIECEFFSRSALETRGVVQHDPNTFAQAVKTIFLTTDRPVVANQPQDTTDLSFRANERKVLLPYVKYRLLREKVRGLVVKLEENNGAMSQEQMRQNILAIIWKHQDLAIEHLHYIEGIQCVDAELWRRDQQWDNVFSFYDPQDNFIKIRRDQLADEAKLETAFLIALGESLLGNYARKKEMGSIKVEDCFLGKVYHLYLEPNKSRHCYFKDDALHQYLSLARMAQVPHDENHFTRLINGDEGFTPPGLLMGLIFAWYLENRLASHIEYKMSVMQINQSALIPEQMKMQRRRERVIAFFRENVFGHAEEMSSC